MPHAPFVHLHLHTQYSLLDGAIQHAPLFKQCKSLGMPAVAMTDHGNLFGMVEFYEKAMAAGVKPILGCEVYIASGSRFDKEKRERDEHGFDAINHLLLLAMNDAGYRNLMYLVSKGYLEGFYYRPRIDLDLLREHSEGLIATSGCLSSMVSRAITSGQPDRAWSLCEEFSRIFPDRYYLELQRHGIPDQDRVNAELLKMHADLRVPLVATNDAHYLHDHDDELHEALLCIGTGSNLDDPKRFKFDGRGFYVKSADEMAEVFHDHPTALANTIEIAERCNVELNLGNYHLPEFQVPSGQSREGVLEEQCWAGLRERLDLAPDQPFTDTHAEYLQRMEHELGVIKSMGFAGYFLIVGDFIAYARKHGIPVGPGRGSSAGSLAAYSLGITGVDPIEYDIIFERFLNPERVSMPDIDVDFCMRGRDQVIQYVREKYDDAEAGDDGRRVAQIITFGKLQARAAIRDVGRVLGMPYGDVDRIAKLIPETLGISLERALEQSPDLRARRDADGQVARLLDVARRLEGLTRHASTHAAGVVIGNRSLIDVVPLYKDPKSGDVMTQLDMKAVERVGLIKFDFLGLKTLTLIADAEERIRAAQPDFSIGAAPLDDPATYELLGRGDTLGVFQIESSGMTELTVKLRPTEFKELIAIGALYRPGPLNSGMVEDYVSRRHGLTKVEYLHPDIEEITRSTLGVIAYQDQVLQIANRMAGYSLGEADLLRRAMGKKVPEEMEKQRERFISGCRERNIEEATATKVFNLMAAFAGYGFPKAHSTAYALITFQTAYLKANYPRDFLAALMSVESGNNDKLARIISHSREREIEVLPPDLNASERDFTVLAEGIRFGLAGVKNVGAGAINAVLEAREAGPFSSVFDFTSRVDARRVNRRVVESLVKCGAFDSVHPERARVWAALDRALESGAAAQRDREIGQASLFGGAGATAVPEPELPDAAQWADRERLGYEKEVLGFYVTGHPLAVVAADLRRYADLTAATTEGRDGHEVRAGGLLTGLRETRTRRGALMAFGTLEDLEGAFDLVIFAEPYERLRELLKRSKDEAHPEPLLVSGTLEAGDTPKILVRDALPLAGAREQLASTLRLRVVAGELSRDRLQALRRVLEAHRGDCAVQLHLVIPGESETLLALPDARGVEASDELLSEVDALFGRPVAELSL